MKSGNISALTGLRGLAAWLVVVYHFREVLTGRFGGWVWTFVDEGFLAVDLFFILSGFVLYVNYGFDFGRLRLPEMLAFYGKRLARIYPLHLVILLLYLANPVALYFFSNAGQLGERYDPLYYLASLLLVQNWGWTDRLAWNVPAWSISTEFAAYLLFPFLALLLGRERCRAGRLAMGLVLPACAIAALYHLAELPSLGSGIGQFGIYRCVAEFFMGMTIGKAYGQWQDTRRIAWYAGAALCVWLVSVTLWQLPDIVSAPLGFVLLIVVLLDGQGTVARWLGSPVLVRIGECSYSTYLVHYLVKDWVKFLSTDLGLLQFWTYLAAVALLSIILYRLVEVPARSWLYGLIVTKKGVIHAG